VRWWKTPRFVKDEEDYKNILAVIKKYFPQLKATHLQLASRSTFPATYVIEYTQYCKRANLIDADLPLSTIDRLFIASNFEVEKTDDNPDKGLIRFEFLELLVRVAKVKLHQPGLVPTLAEAVEKVIAEHILPVAEYHEWQGFRDHVLYTVEVNDVLHTNQAIIKRVYDSYLTTSKKFFTMADATDLFAAKSECAMLPKDVMYCYGMSKMTVPLENGEIVKYDRLLFVEFLEMIGRVADFKFKGTELEDIALDKKIEEILD